MPGTTTEQWRVTKINDHQYEITNGEVTYIYPDQASDIPQEVLTAIMDQIADLADDGIVGDDVVDYEDAIDDEEVADDTGKKSTGKQRPGWTILDFGDKSGSGPASGSWEPLGPQESYRRMPTDFLERTAKTFAENHPNATNWAALELAQRGVPGYAQYGQTGDYQDAPTGSTYGDAEDHAKPEPVVEDKPTPKGPWDVSTEDLHGGTNPFTSDPNQIAELLRRRINERLGSVFSNL